jgi:hypothetical protein
MTFFYPLVLITLLSLLVCIIVRPRQASALPAQLELQTLPVSEIHGTIQGDWRGIAVSGTVQVNGDALSGCWLATDLIHATPGTL